MPTFCYSLFGIEWTHVRGERPVPAGEHQVGVEFAYDGGGIDKGGDFALHQDGEQVASGRVERTGRIEFGYESTDVERDNLSPVTDDNPSGETAFTGIIERIEMEGGNDSHDHVIDPGLIFHFAMAKQ